MRSTITRRSSTFPERLLIVLVISLLTQNFLQAEESSDLPDVLKRCQAALARLKYVAYTVKGTPLDELDHPRLQMTWREEDNKLGYHYLQWKDDGTLNFQADYSYDGLRSFNAWYGKGLYYTRIAPRPFDDWIKNLMFITAPFNFLLQAEGIPAWQQPNIELLQDQRTWARLSKDAVVLGPQTYRNHECMVIRINHSGAARFSLDIYYVVYFDLKNARPIAWKLYDEHDHLLEDDNVMSEQMVMEKEQEVYVAPKQIREDFYSYDSVKQTVTRTHSWLFDFSDIVAEKPSDEAFGLGPAMVAQIYDEDAKIWIHPQAR